MNKAKKQQGTATNGAGGEHPSGSPESKKFDSFAIVEVLGHNTFAGRVTDESIGGASFIRVDVPKIPMTKYYPEQPAFTKYIGAGSIYAITPCSEDVAMRAATETRQRPISMLSLEARPALAARAGGDHEGDDDR